MDDQKSGSQKTDMPAGMENDTPRVNDVPQYPQNTPETQPNKHRRGHPLLLLAILLIAALGGAAGYYKLHQTLPVAVDDLSNSQAVIEPQRNLYFQVGSKIMKYNQNDKSTSTLTAVLPNGSEVLDFFADNASWRAIYRTTPQTDAEAQKIFLIENDKQPVTLVENAQYITAAAARHRMVAYSLPADTTESTGAAARTRTFLAKAGEETEEILTSNPWNQETPSSDVKNYLYTPREISNNGDKLLLSLLSCFQCDGPPLAAAFEMDLESKEVKPIYLSDEPGYVTFNSLTGGFKGYKIIESNNLSLASDEPYELTISQVDAPGAPAEQEFKASENDWTNLVLSLDRGHVAIEKKDKTFTATGKTTFDGIYDFAGAIKPADMKKLSVSGLPVDKYIVQSLGVLYGDCLGVAMYERAVNNPSSTNTTQEAGAICKAAEGYSYVKIDDLESGNNEAYQTVKALDHL